MIRVYHLFLLPFLKKGFYETNLFPMFFIKVEANLSVKNLFSIRFPTANMTPHISVSSLVL